MNINELLRTTPQTLADEQYKALLQDTLTVLDDLKSALNRRDWTAIDNMIDFSGSGDGYGNDNHFIAFACGDILETVEKLQELDKIRDKNKSF